MVAFIQTIGRKCINTKEPTIVGSILLNRLRPNWNDNRTLVVFRKVIAAVAIPILPSHFGKVAGEEIGNTVGIGLKSCVERGIFTSADGKEFQCSITSAFRFASSVGVTKYAFVFLRDNFNGHSAWPGDEASVDRRYSMTNHLNNFALARH